MTSTAAPQPSVGPYVALWLMKTVVYIAVLLGCVVLNQLIVESDDVAFPPTSCERQWDCNRGTWKSPTENAAPAGFWGFYVNTQGKAADL